MKNILVINPYIYDFKMYDEWRRPLGAYYLAHQLKKYNVDINFIDILDRYDKEFKVQTNLKEKKYSTGRYFEKEVEKPSIYSSIPRRYRRFGMPEDCFREKLSKVKKVDLICITSKMTYWYLGIQFTIKIIKEFFPNTPIILGGTYATLMSKHAKQFSGADHILSGNINSKTIEFILDLLSIENKFFPIEDDFYFPKYIKYFGNLLASFGCPYKCTYCASKILQNNYRILNGEKIYKHFKTQMNKGSRHFCFYDDALLVNFNKNLKPFFEKIIMDKNDVTFHAPNGLHAKYVTKEIADLMIKAGLKTIRFGFESLDESVRKETGYKVGTKDLLNAINHFQNTKQKDFDIGVYLLNGLEGQNNKTLSESIKWIKGIGASPKLLNLSPIPRTSIFEKLASKYPIIRDEPLSQNDSYFNLLRDSDHFKKMNELKHLIQSTN